MYMGESLMDIGNFMILIVSGAMIPILLVLYKSRCSSICFGCIKRDPPPIDGYDKKSHAIPVTAKEHRLSLELKEPEPEPEKLTLP